MPVQINEVIIRAVVDPIPRPAGSAEAPGAHCSPSGNSGPQAEVVERILEILQEKRER